jgi:sugar phosphate isomerase/epimerase
MRYESLRMIVLLALAMAAMPAMAQSGTKDAGSGAKTGAAAGGDTETYTGGAPHAEAIGWKLGCQAYSFNRFTFFEAVDKVALMGLRYIEAYPGQRLSADMAADVVFDHNMSADIQQKARAYLEEKDVNLVNYGVVGLPDDEAESRKVFDFAKAMGIETIVSEPDYDAFKMLDKLAQEYGINVAIHNHPKPSKYWNYEKVLEVSKGCSERIGACADTGHWMRSGIKPVEALKALEGRIVSFHLKDLNEFGKRSAHDTIWGQGKADMDAILKELKRQHFKGVFSVEYEHNWENSVPEISQCAKYFDEMAAKLSESGSAAK